MIKATAKMADGRVLLVMGLSEMNFALMREGKPIYFDPAGLRIAATETIGAITVFYGKTDQALADQLRNLIGPETEVIAVPRGDDRPV